MVPGQVSGWELIAVMNLDHNVPIGLQVHVNHYHQTIPLLNTLLQRDDYKGGR